MKKILSGFVAFVTAAILCIMSAGAETYGDFTYVVRYDTVDTVLITGYTGNDTELIIPSEIDGKRVSGIDGMVFRDCTSLTSVVIPDGVTSIGIWAFECCSSLTSVTIPDSVTTIKTGAFMMCTSLKSITIPYGVTTIEYDTFIDCESLTSVVIPDSVTSIGDQAFLGCSSLTSVTIPDSVTNIDGYAFYDCDSLVHISIPDSVTSIGEYAFYDCELLTSIIIPDSVTSIGMDAFDYTNTIYCNKGSYAEQYAKENNYNYRLIDAVYPPSDIELEEITSDKLVLNWEKDNNVDGYTIYLWDGESYVELGTTNECSYEINNLSACNKYKIAISSYLTVGDEVIESEFYETEIQTLHNYSEAYTTDIKATCEKDGSMSRHCMTEGCTATTDVTVIPATGHNYIETVVKPTYTEQGYTYHECSVCGNNFKDNIVEKLTLEKVAGLKLGGRASDALRLNWTKNDTADGYIIEQYKDGKWVRIKKITSNATTTYRVTGLTAGTAYKFRMRAYKMDGTKALYSEYTSTFAARTNPSVVTGLKIGGRASNALRLNWTKNTSADGYIIEQYKDGKWVRIKKVTSNATTTYRVAGLKASTQYKFRVRAYKMSGSTALYSGYTSTLAAYTNPSAVSNLKITGKAGTALRLGWSKNTSADGYIVEMYSGGKWVRVAKVTSNATITYRKAGLAKGTTYKFRVATYNIEDNVAYYGAYVTVSGTTNS
ncbi:MAG: leucine-rich repeat protein [Ruminiclostridium sp.]|nr:leucine-rich repeat protein [Ruminiclostridium sp.]